MGWLTWIGRLFAKKATIAPEASWRLHVPLTTESLVQLPTGRHWKADPSPEPKPAETRGQRIRRLRRAQGLTLNDFSTKCGINPQCMSVFERDLAQATESEMARMAAVLHLPAPQTRRTMGTAAGAHSRAQVDPSPFASELRRRRVGAGLSGKDVAELVGITSSSAVYSWEHGKNRPSPELLARLREVFGADLPTPDAPKRKT